MELQLSIELLKLSKRGLSQRAPMGHRRIQILELHNPFRIRDFMLNKKDILGWNISIKLMDIQSMLN